ncbi:MAG TPA: sigma 54-interacting transcriptional regulator [Thermoanaerobaculia bacterium]|nr:sigma 54-interacting transcriptional regulator [Thermoanaerobaculia bacterium]
MDLNKRSSLIESVFAGGGEMGARMRAFDWSTTALGAVEQWPQSLRICVRIMLAAGYPFSILWGPDYINLYNDAQREMYGAKFATALGSRIRDIWPEAWDSMAPIYDRVLREGQAFTTLGDHPAWLNRHDFLEECYFALSCSPIPDDSGHIGGVFVTGMETTRRVIEERRLQVIRDLASRTAEARYEDEVWRAGAATLGEHRLAVPFAFLYACRPGEGNASRVGPVVAPDTLDPPVIDCTRQNLWGFDVALPKEGLVVEVGERASLLSTTDSPVPLKNAAVLPIRFREDSNAVGFAVLGIHPGRPFDETYRQFLHRIAEQIAIGLASARAYEQERQRADALAEIDRAKTAFFSNVSHEFRTPLALMLGPLEEVLPDARERLSPERHEQLATVRRNALRLLKLVNTLLDFSRIEAGRAQAVYEPTDLARVTAEIASVFRSAMENGGLRFSVECEPIVEPVYVDRDMWEKVISNLLSNAFKFTFEGGVTITLKSENGMVELQVRDTGVGIPEDQQERVFDRFHRIEGAQARTYEGSGIGLAFVQELVRLNGGHVRVQSGVGQGSTFTVTLPLGTAHLPAERVQAPRFLERTGIGADAYAEEAQRWLSDDRGTANGTMIAEPGTPPPFSPESQPTGKRELIIVADDNADMRQYLRRLLGGAYEVHAVSDGSQALEVARRLRPALLLVDVMMPRLDGFGVLRAVRDDTALAGMPVILLSARAGEESRLEGLHAGADDYLVKPFTSRELLARVETHLKMATLRRDMGEREERLRMEAELERAKLRASEELLVETSRLYRQLQGREAKIRRLVDANVVGICFWDLEGRILEANDAFLRVIQYGREDLLSGTVRWTELTPTEWRERDESAMAEIEATSTVQPYEKEFFRKDGSRVPVLAGGALFEEGGKEGVAFVLDLSEQKRAEAEIRALKEQLYKENLVLRDEVDRTSMFEEIVGTSQALQPVLARVSKVARTDSTVLITGETGTGKELVARAIHRRSARAARTFVSVNCAAIPRELIASELFGHEKGAFTGATQRRLGRFELAHGGTIFLDEIGDLPMETQVALLRVLQEREFERVGGTASVRVDVRVIAATNRDPQAAVEAGTFRSDLFYRLNVFPITVPALRERADDIPLLVEYFIDRYARKSGRTFRRVQKRTLDHLISYPWPGNVRELQNVIERSMIVCDSDEFIVDESWLSTTPDTACRRLSNTLAHHEKAIIEGALRASGGRVFGPSGAASRLGIARSTLESKIRGLGIDKNRFRPRPTNR